MASYIFTGGSFLPLAGNKVVNNGNLLTMKDSDKIIVGGEAYSLGDYFSLDTKYPDLGPVDCCYIIGDYIYSNDGTNRQKIENVAKLFGSQAILKDGTYGTDKCHSFIPIFYTIHYPAAYLSSSYRNIQLLGAISQDNAWVINNNKYIPQQIVTAWKIKQAVLWHHEEDSQELDDLIYEGTLYVKHTVMYVYSTVIFIGAKQDDPESNIKEDVLYIHDCGYEERHLYYRDVAGAMPIVNKIYHEENATPRALGKCTYLSNIGLMAIIDGQLYSSIHIGTYSPQHGTFRLVDDSTGWSWCTGVCLPYTLTENNESSQDKTTFYGYALKEELLYIYDPDYNFLQIVDKDKKWSCISEYPLPRTAERITESGELITYGWLIYGISSGNLYQINGKTVTLVDASGDWEKTWGECFVQSGNCHIYAFAARSNGHLYRIADTTLTDLGHIING